ncbi:hypothetical protein FUMI01_13570 [Flavobacterium sp. UMI-01]|nr:hypothetical protein FUMI01_13570 [Flavobacterium sp. UMI-01]
MNCVATIYQGTCGGTVLATQNVSFATGSTNTLKEITFNTPANLVSGQNYTLQLSVLPNQMCDEDFLVLIPINVSAKWYQGSALCGGASYVGGSAYNSGCIINILSDYYFQTFINNTTLNNQEFISEHSILIVPNPTNDYIHINGLNQPENFNIYNNEGKIVLEGIIENNKTIDVQSLTHGIYYLKLTNGKRYKFLKN